MCLRLRWTGIKMNNCQEQPANGNSKHGNSASVYWFRLQNGRKEGRQEMNFEFGQNEQSDMKNRVENETRFAEQKRGGIIEY